MSRRSIRDKQKENKDLRLILLSLYKLPNIRVLYLGEIDEQLRASIFRCAQTESFVAKRRYEREAVNLLRDEDEEGIHFLENIHQCLDELHSKLNQEVQTCIEGLHEPKVLGTFCEENPHLEVQQLRQYLRSKKAKHQEKLRALISDVLFPLA